MKKIRIHDLVNFNKKSERSKITQVNNFKKEIPEVEKNKKDSGGDYWISCNSALIKYFKTEDTKVLNHKIEHLKSMIDNTPRKQTKDRFNSNIDRINNFISFNIKEIKPSEEIKILKKEEKYPKLKINDLTIEVKPDIIYSFNDDEIGSVWFITKKGGFKSNELAMFCDINFRYLTKVYSEKHNINTDFVTVIDVFNTSYMTYSQIKDGEIISPLNNTIEEFKKLLR
ncbi:hypothetical protein [Empedobacter falsenii]|uniref:Uncharacterized protein n=1 Tax=Empedobacter falsenii TaxID=343874 RepID=A0A3R8UCA6_9FLAO|nr:hypothetical protein [Empedobacter falsenii]RRT90073.1 hypothetical protein EGI89_10060 [Empedobacter falsenii]RRT90150.1 hypothetical protein EGI88_10140 [Empedobacter falsenii]